MIIKDKKTLATYQQAGQLSSKILNQLRQAIAVGVTPSEIDKLAEKLCTQNHVKPCFKGVGPKNNQYQYTTCISVNDIVLHGIPGDTPFASGDLVKVDFGIEYQGLNTDHCFTVGVENVSAKDQQLLRVAKQAVQKAAYKAKTGNRVGDLSATMFKVAVKAGFDTVKEYVGHGIGYTLHDDPQIPSYGKPHTGPILQEGMVLCVECQVVGGRPDVYTDDDGWTIKTLDGSKAAMFEYMVVVQKNKPLFLTNTLDWPILV